MGHAKTKKDLNKIYRSRQSGRTDIEELLASNFNPDRQELSVIVVPTVGVPPTEGLTPTVLSPEQLTKPLETQSSSEPSLLAIPTEGTTRPEGVPTTEGLTSSVGVTPTVVESSTVGETILAEREIWPERIATPSVVILPAVEETPSVGGTDVWNLSSDGPKTGQAGPTEVVPPTVGGSLSYEKLPETTRPTIALPTVGVAPTDRNKAPNEIAAQWISMASGKLYEAGRVKRIDIAQHSLSMGENHLYQALWAMHRTDFFRLQFESKQLRRFSAGYDVLARVGRLNEKSIRDLLPKLKAKKVLVEIEEADPAARKGKTYEVYSYQQILQRQREAGLCFVVNNGKAVEFATPYSTRPVSGMPTDSPAVPPTVGATPTVGDYPTESVGEHPTLTVGQTPTLLDKTKQNRQTTSPADLAERIEQLIPGIDQGAINRIWREGREMVSDATVEEILFFLEERARIVFRNRRLENPTGLLLSSIGDWLTERRVFARRKQQAEDAAELERITADIEKNLHGGWE